MGVAGDFIGNLTQNNVQQAQGGTFPGLENYFFPREVELSLFGQIDPYARAEVRFEAEQESRGGELSVNLAEANLTLMALPFNTQAKLGMMRNRFGLMNQIHDHDLPFIDRPDVLVQFFGRRGAGRNGRRGHVGAAAALLRGAARRPLQRRQRDRLRPRQHQVPARHRARADVLRARGLRRAPARHVGRQRAAGRPAEQSHPRLGRQVQVSRRRAGSIRCSPSAASCSIRCARSRPPGDRGDDRRGRSRRSRARPGRKQTLNRVGWYLLWRGPALPLRAGSAGFSPGFRYDWTEYPTDAGSPVGGAAVPQLHAVRVPALPRRLQAHGGQHAGLLHATPASAARAIKDEFFFQSTFILGAHPSHPF